MDPNEALKALRANPNRETFDALDTWLTSGGFLPTEWQPKQPETITDAGALWAYIMSGRHDYTRQELAEEIQDACAVGVRVDVTSDSLQFSYHNFPFRELPFPFTLAAYEAALDPVEDENAAAIDSVEDEEAE